MEINSYTPYIPAQNNTNEMSSKITKAYDENDHKELKEACKDFESIFLNMMLKEMRKSVPTSDDSYAMNTFNEMFDEEISKELSNGKGIGIADMMYKQLSVKLNNTYKINE